MIILHLAISAAWHSNCHYTLF